MSENFNSFVEFLPIKSSDYVRLPAKMAPLLRGFFIFAGDSEPKYWLREDSK
jgi:hypothetical protein